jgi:hypothetical protein
VRLHEQRGLAGRSSTRPSAPAGRRCSPGFRQRLPHSPWCRKLFLPMLLRTPPKFMKSSATSTSVKMVDTDSSTRKMSRQQLKRELPSKPLRAVPQFQIPRRIMHTAGALLIGFSTVAPAVLRPYVWRQLPRLSVIPPLLHATNSATAAFDRKMDVTHCQ